MLQKLYGPLDVAYSDELDAKERAHSLDAPKKCVSHACPIAFGSVALFASKLLPKRVPFCKRLVFGGRPSFVANRFTAKDAVLGVPFEFFHQVFD